MVSVIKRHQMKKAQGISINVIVIAAIALAVLVVLFAIFTGKIGIFSREVEKTDNCVSRCSAIGKERGTDLIAEGSQCPISEDPISGGKFGCCCREKLV